MIYFINTAYFLPLQSVQAFNLYKNIYGRFLYEVMRWLPDDFDSEEFNIDEINELLQKENFGCIAMFD